MQEPSEGILKWPRQLAEAQLDRAQKFYIERGFYDPEEIEGMIEKIHDVIIALFQGAESIDLEVRVDRTRKIHQIDLIINDTEESLCLLIFEAADEGCLSRETSRELIENSLPKYLSHQREVIRMRNINLYKIFQESDPEDSRGFMRWTEDQKLVLSPFEAINLDESEFRIGGHRTSSFFWNLFLAYEDRLNPDERQYIDSKISAEGTGLKTDPIAFFMLLRVAAQDNPMIVVEDIGGYAFRNMSTPEIPEFISYDEEKKQTKINFFTGRSWQKVSEEMGGRYPKSFFHRIFYFCQIYQNCYVQEPLENTILDSSTIEYIQERIFGGKTIYNPMALYELFRNIFKGRDDIFVMPPPAGAEETFAIRYDYSPIIDQIRELARQEKSGKKTSEEVRDLVIALAASVNIPRELAIRRYRTIYREKK